MEKLTDLANKSDEFKHGYCNGRIDEEYLWKCKIKAKIEELKETADEDNMEDFVRIGILQSLLGKE